GLNAATAVVGVAALVARLVFVGVFLGIILGGVVFVVVFFGGIVSGGLLVFTARLFGVVLVGRRLAIFDDHAVITFTGGVRLFTRDFTTRRHTAVTRVVAPATGGDAHLGALDRLTRIFERLLIRGIVG